MRSLYWKIFISFWFTTILIILTTAWVIGEIAQKSSVPARERVFMDSHATAAIATLESGSKDTLLKWMKQSGKRKDLTFYLLTNSGEIISNAPPSTAVKRVAQNLLDEMLDDGMVRYKNMILSHEIVSTSGNTYRLLAISDKPLAHFLTLPLASLSIRLVIAMFFSGLICYFLSLYFTRPLRSLGEAANSIARGKLHTRVGELKLHGQDEIAKLSHDFDTMAEQLETMIESKERLLSDISHELRSPLARLQIAAEIGRNKTKNLAEEEFDRIELETQRLNQLIGEILEFARMDKSTETLHPEQVNLAALIQQLIDNANFGYENSKAKVVWDNKLDIICVLDKRLVQRSIDNVIRNAQRYTPVDKTVKIDMHLNNKTIRVNVADHGPGVPEAELENIFSPFYRVDTSREKKTGGYGLGLSIAQKGILLHHGHISAENRPQGGLLVRMELPQVTQ